MPMSQTLSRVALCSVLSTAAAFGQTPIQGISFENLPAGTTLVGTDITLQGNATVQGGLGISGNLTLGPGSAVVFNPPRQGSLMLGPGDFVPQILVSNNQNWAVAAYYYFPAANGFSLGGLAPVHLPQGAAVNSFRCWFYDNDPVIDFDSFTNASLNGRFPNSVDYDNYFNVNGLAAVHQENALIEVIGSEQFPLVIDPTHSYFVRFGMQLTAPTTSANTFRFYGCRIDYEVATWAP